MQHTLPGSKFAFLPNPRFLASSAAGRRFSRRLFGADPKEVIQYLGEADAAVRNLIEAFEQERAGLEGRLRDATRQAETLRSELTAAEQCTAAYYADEMLIGRTLVRAQKMAEELQRTAQAEAEEILGKAETIANDIVQTGCRNASETMRKAQQESDAMVQAAKENATELLDLVRRETRRLAVDAHETFQRAHRSVEQDIATAASRLDVHIPQSELEARPPDRDRDLLSPEAPGGPTPLEQLGATSQPAGAHPPQFDGQAGPANGSGNTGEPDAAPQPPARSVVWQGATVWAVTAAVFGIVSQLRRFGLSFFG